MLENPDLISRTVLSKGLDAGTAFEILSIDIADVDVGRNIGAQLQMDQAEADRRIAQALDIVRANPGINATIKDKYFNSAASAPAGIFPVLNNLYQKHLRKLETGQRVYFDKQVSTLKGVLGESYPTRMTLAQQGSFDLGYYHQTQKRYTKKEENENV